MKRTILSLALLVVCTHALVAQPKVVAHRGYWRAEGSAQNSISSLRAAAELGCWGSEFDVWLTADDKLVLYHDNDFEGERVERLTMDLLAHHRLENGEPLPLLEEFLGVAQEYPKLHLVFELKPHDDKSREAKAVAASVAMIEQMGLAHRTVYISFSLEACKEFVRLAPEAKVFYLTGNLSARELHNLGLAGANYNQSIYHLSPKLIRRVHDYDMQVGVWTVNEEHAMEWMADHDVDYLTTDYPHKALELYNVGQ